MTWWSEHSAVPRFVLARSAIRCRFVDRFVGSRVPSHVSGQRFSTHGVSLPSAGSRRARFPAFTGTYEDATTSRPRNPAPLWLRLQAPRAPPMFVLAEGAPDGRGGRSPGLEQLVSRCSLIRRTAPMGANGISQVSWRSVPCLCPAPRPRPSRQDLAFGGLVDTAPGQPKPKASAGT